jgi:hypothetical protein
MATNTTEQSDILLLCLGPDTDQTSIKDVNVADLFEVFSIFGTLSKVIIFKKKVLLKAFLQFRKVDHAVRARLELHDTFINDFGKAKLFFSALQELSFSNKYLEYKEYSLHESQEPEGDNYSSVVSMSILNSSKGKSFMSKFDRLEIGSENGKHDGKEGPRPSLFNPIASKYRSTVGGILSEIKNPDNFNSAFSSKSLLMSNPVNPTISRLVLQKGSNFGSAQRDSIQSSKRDSENTNIELSACPVQQTPSKVILISNLFNCFDTVNEVFNVFSCFGNIYKVLLMKNLKKAMVEYTSVEFAQAAQAAMNNQAFGSSKIKVSFSKYKKIDLKKNNKSENSQQFNEVMIASKVMHRFESDLFGHVESPSENLLIECEKGRDVLPIDIFIQVQSIIKPQNFKVVNEDKENQEAGEDSFRILSKFSSVKEALVVLSKCHNTDVKGLPLKISFATSSNN